MANLMDALPPISTNVMVGILAAGALVILMLIERGFRGVKVSLS